MSAVEYSLIFLSIIIGYITTVSVVSWGKLIKHYRPETFSPEYLFWSLFLFLYLLFIWFWTFSYHLIYLNSYFWFTLLLVRPILIYFCVEILVPDDFQRSNYRDHFEMSKRRFFILLSILWLFEIGLYLLMGHPLLGSSRGILYVVSLPISLVLVFAKSKKVHRVLSVISLMMMVLLVASHMRDQIVGL